MQNVRIGLLWAGAILATAFLAKSFDLGEQVSFAFVSGLSVLAVIHLGRSRAKSTRCQK
jgi:hypothetical protein